VLLPCLLLQFGLQNLQEMVYLLNGTPRAVVASLAVPGQRSSTPCPLAPSG
jgi:hypothetical protein